jgi:hypothetical protein
MRGGLSEEGRGEVREEGRSSNDDNIGWFKLGREKGL